MILLDVNIFIDVLKEQEGFEQSARIIDLVKEKKLSGCISGLTPPILWFLSEKDVSETEAKEITKTITKGFSVIPLNQNILNQAFGSEIRDFEDAIQICSAVKGKCEALITRNKRDFGAHKGISILTPEEFLTSPTI